MGVAFGTHTTTALLEGLFDFQNSDAWRELDDRFRPILTDFAQRLGLDGADAADVAQETLSQFLRDYRNGKYDRNRGRLRAWILGIARHRIAETHRTRAGRREWRGQSAMLALSDDGDLDALWDRECRQAALCFALRQLSENYRLNERTISAFRMHVLEGVAPDEVAQTLGTSVRAVYIAKHRCLSRLREAMAQLSESYDLS